MLVMTRRSLINKLMFLQRQRQLQKHHLINQRSSGHHHHLKVTIVLLFKEFNILVSTFCLLMIDDRWCGVTVDCFLLLYSLCFCFHSRILSSVSLFRHRDLGLVSTACTPWLEHGCCRHNNLKSNKNSLVEYRTVLRKSIRDSLDF